MTFPKKADIWLLAGILTAALAILLLFRLNRTQGSFAKVSCGGVILMEIPLSQTETAYYLITGQAPLQAEEAEADAAKEEGADTAASLVSIEEFSETEWAEISRAGSAAAKDFYNIILYQNGEVRMLESSCPDLICVHHRAVRDTGESIICLPHKIVVEIIGAKERDLDGVVY